MCKIRFECASVRTMTEQLELHDKDFSLLMKNYICKIDDHLKKILRERTLSWGAHKFTLALSYGASGD